MRARPWKWIGAGVLTLALAATGVVLRQNHEESAAKAVLAAEIEARRAGRSWPVEPLPTPEEAETAALYGRAISKLRSYELDAYSDFIGATDHFPWREVPESVSAVLAANAEALELADAAAARGGCRFPSPEGLPQRGCMELLGLLESRGHAALAGGSPLAAAEEVRRLVRVGRHLATAPLPRGVPAAIHMKGLCLRSAEGRAAGLLATIATTEGLPAEVGPVLAAAARDPWRTPEAHRQILLVAEDGDDALALVLLGPGAEAHLEEVEAKTEELDALLSVGPPKGSRSLRERLEDRVRGVLRPGLEVPLAAEWREWREESARVVAAMRRWDVEALALGGSLGYSRFGFLSARWFRACVGRECRNAVARAAAAVRSFQFVEGRPPRDLEELAAAGFAEVVVDPFDGRPLDYEVEGDRWRVASRVWYGADPEATGILEEGTPAAVSFPRGSR